MNRRELVLAIAEKAEVDRKTAEAMMSAFTEVVTETVSSGDPVTISGFAKFARVETKARMGRNPQTGAPIKIPARKKVRVTPLKAFKDTVLAGKPARKKAPAKKAPAKKAPAKKAPAKKAAARKAPAKR